MFLTCGTVVPTDLRQRACLFPTSVTVLDVVFVRFMLVCVRFMTNVPDTGDSAELWRFDTSTLRWETVDSTTANGAVPSARSGHVMTSVGRNLWMHGGRTASGEGDTCS
jgi:hypothetical protein